MLGWEIDKPKPKPKPCVFVYDVRANHGWVPASPDLGSQLPIINFNGKRPFFVTDEDPNLGSFHLLFNYEPQSNPPSVSAYYMSDDLLSFQSISEPIQLPKLCCDYILEGDLKDEIEDDLKYQIPNVCSDFEFVYLGKRKFGLVLHKYFEDHCDQGTNTGIILLLTYEYDITSPTEINTRLLTTRRFRYHARKMQHTLYYTAFVVLIIKERNSVGETVIKHMVAVIIQRLAKFILMEQFCSNNLLFRWHQSTRG